MHLCVKEMNNNIIVSGFEPLCQLICNDLVKIVPCYVFRCVPPQKIYAMFYPPPHFLYLLHPIPQDVTFFGNRVLADVIG